MKVGETYSFRDGVVFVVVDKERAPKRFTEGWVGLILEGFWPVVGVDFVDGKKLAAGRTFTFAPNSSVVIESVRFPSKE